MLGRGWIRVVTDRLACEKHYVEIVVLQSKCAFVSMGIHSTVGLEGLLLLPGGGKGYSGGSIVQDLFGFVCFLFTLWC